MIRNTSLTLADTDAQPAINGGRATAFWRRPPTVAAAPCIHRTAQAMLAALKKSGHDIIAKVEQAQGVVVRNWRFVGTWLPPSWDSLSACLRRGQEHAVDGVNWSSPAQFPKLREAGASKQNSGTHQVDDDLRCYLPLSDLGGSGSAIL
jgi:hypothetical protein